MKTPELPGPVAGFFEEMGRFIQMVGRVFA